jgi:hypothetical protein
MGASKRSGWTVVAAAAVVAGVAVRAWILSSPLGALEADEAIVGLMARHALDGELSVFYWGALYGGTQEALLTAVVFAVAGSSVLALKLVSLAIFSAAAVLVWLVGRRTVGPSAALVGAALFWVWPAYFVWWTTKARGYFGSGLVIGLAALLFAQRLRERDSRADAAGLGFALGLGLWATLQSWLLALPALAWLVARRPAVLRLAWLAVPVALVGSLPWLVWNARNGWEAVLPRSVRGEESTYLGRLGDFFEITLPTWLGLRVPFSLDWLVPAPLGYALVVLALAGFALLLVRRPPGLEPLLVVGAAFPFLYAASSFTFFVAEPRYLVFLAPVPALLLGRLLAARGPVVAGAGLAAAFALSVAGLVVMERQDRFAPIAPDVRVPADLSPVLAVLEREGQRRVLANYWIAYRIGFESDERIVATSTGFVRHEPTDRLVRSSPRPARVFVEGSAEERRAGPGLLARGFRRVEAGGFAVYVASRAGG